MRREGVPKSLQNYVVGRGSPLPRLPTGTRVVLIRLGGAIELRRGQPHRRHAQVEQVIPSDEAEIWTAPPFVNTPSSAFVIDAETTLDMSLNASDSPIATDTPASPPDDPASDAAPATALITEES